MIGANSVEHSAQLPSGKCPEGSNANAGPRTPASNLQVKSVALKVRHHFQCSASFHDNRTFFRRKEVAQIFISHIEFPAPEATPSLSLLPSSNLEGQIRAFRL